MYYIFSILLAWSLQLCIVLEVFRVLLHSLELELSISSSAEDTDPIFGEDSGEANVRVAHGCISLFVVYVSLAHHKKETGNIIISTTSLFSVNRFHVLVNSRCVSPFVPNSPCSINMSHVL